MTGLIRETVGLASVILGIVIAGLFHGNVSDNLSIVTGEGAGTEIAAYLLIFAVVSILGLMASFLLRTTSRLLFLGWADHAAGAFFGFVKGILIIQAIAVIFVLQPALGLETTISDSTIGSFFLGTTPFIQALLPSEFDTAIRDFTIS